MGVEQDVVPIRLSNQAGNFGIVIVKHVARRNVGMNSLTPQLMVVSIASAPIVVRYNVSRKFTHFGSRNL